MGACSSCLGLNRRSSQSDPSDTSQLLGEQYQPHYGTTVTPGIPHPDPEEIRRQRDALERLCAQTSDNLIDVSQPLHHADAAVGPSVRPNFAHDYPRLFNERFNVALVVNQPNAAPLAQTHESRDSSRPSSSRDTVPEEDEASWLAQVLEQPGALDTQDMPPWERVAGDFRGKLIWDFDSVMREGKPAARLG